MVEMQTIYIKMNNIVAAFRGICMCHLWNIAMLDYQESLTTGQTAGQSDPYVLLCFAGDTIN